MSGTNSNSILWIMCKWSTCYLNVTLCSETIIHKHTQVLPRSTANVLFTQPARPTHALCDRTGEEERKKTNTWAVTADRQRGKECIKDIWHPDNTPLSRLLLTIILSHSHYQLYLNIRQLLISSFGHLCSCLHCWYFEDLYLH